MDLSSFKITDESGDKKYFTIIPNYIVNHSTPYEQAIYLFMKRVAGENGTCWMSASSIGKKLGTSANTIKKYRKKLVERGWIKKIGEVKTGQTNQIADEYKIVDLWELNAEYYKKVSNNDSLKVSTDDGKLSTSDEKVSPVGRKEEPIKNNPEEKRESRFAPPSLEETINYCLERKNSINASQFIDFYSSKGWMVGKNKMKDWRAAIRTWENRDNFENKSNKNNILKPNNPNKYDKFN